jgi:hypothetical protein
MTLGKFRRLVQLCPAGLTLGSISRDAESDKAVLQYEHGLVEGSAPCTCSGSHVEVDGQVFPSFWAIPERIFQ